MAVYVPPRPAAKAATGVGVQMATYDTPLSALRVTPQKLASEAQALYHRHPWVHVAEKAVSGRGGAVEWHLEDENDDEVTDESSSQLLAIRDLIEQPQANVEGIGRPMRRRELWTLTLRHAGLCGTGFWLLDQLDSNGIPSGVIYLNPARMWPAEDGRGNLLGWSLDGEPGSRGALPLELIEVLPFYLDPPDGGHLGIGIVESAITKARLSSSVDRYISGVLDSGGRLAGIVSPKANSSVTITDDQWNQFVRDARQIAEDPQAAKRLQAVRGPIDFTRTSATPNEVNLSELETLSRDDILALWNVPGSQIGLPINRALGQGSAQSFEEAVLWQNAIGPRLTMLYETIQYGLLDRFAAIGIKVELDLEIPSFDDDTPKYDLAQKAEGQPLTRNERRAILDLDPLPDWSDTGEPLGIAIDLPIQVAVVGQGESETPRPATPPPPPAPPPPASPTQPMQPMIGAPMMPVKAVIRRPLTALRTHVNQTMTPRIRRSLSQLLADQRREVAARLRKATPEEFARQRTNAQHWFDAAHETTRLRKALEPTVLAISTLVAQRTSSVLAPRTAKADPLVDTISAKVTAKIGTRISGITQTTQDAVVAAIEQGYTDGLTPLEIADLIDGLPEFDDDRAELVARTETMFAYNSAALGSYGEFGVEQVEAIDGDGDEECADRDGQVFSIDEADGIEDHPNGTLDWVPVV